MEYVTVARRLTLQRLLLLPVLGENLMDLSLQKATMSEEIKGRPAIGPAVVDK